MPPGPRAPEDAPPPNVDRFEVKISNVRGELRTAEARPVFLRFDFDKSFWERETTVYSADVNPEWSFAPKNGTTTADTRFVYRTEHAHRMHKKYLSVTLSERSPHGDVAWGSGTVSLDSLALGCENIALNMIASDDVTCYGTVRFNLSMVNVAEVTVHLSDLLLMDYPERFAHDVKLVYFEFGLTGFEKGYRHCTERRSDKEPRFYSRPALKRDCKLREMVSPAPTGQGPMRIFFSVHRQVARNRTEQIGLGALPVRMLFQKVANGYMEVPTKFKVPLQNKQGVLKGKVLLRNIPRFHQLPGDDLVNVNGVITPIDEDLEQRKIVPWMKLPRPLIAQSKKPPPPIPPPHRIENDNHTPSISMITAVTFDTHDHVNGGYAPISPNAPLAQPHDNSLPLRVSPHSRDDMGYRVDHMGADPASPPSNGAAGISDGISSLNLYSANGDSTYAQESNGRTRSGRSLRSESGTPMRRTKSGKSMPSFGTLDGGVEIGSGLNSVASEEGMNADSAGESEWVAVEDASNGLFYFASKITNESLWLPPDWEREMSADGRFVFVDYGCGKRQFAFPANEARRYRESVYTRE